MSAGGTGSCRSPGRARRSSRARWASALLVAAYYLTPPLLRVHFLLTRSVLGPGEGELAERVRVLTETRRDAVDTSAAELRRIERDLHDGAQARLVAMGMDLGTIEALVEKDPAKAKEMLAQARKSSAEALTELRDLVRGIHPPVLAERGLGDAVRALALRLPLASEVDVELDGPAGRAGGGRGVLRRQRGADQRGQALGRRPDLGRRPPQRTACCGSRSPTTARAAPGSTRVPGLTGVERRLGTFDGVLAVSSPAGGPTMVTMEIPCELS